MPSDIQEVHHVSATDSASLEEPFIATGNTVTSAIISSESGDRSLYVFDSTLTVEEIQKVVYDQGSDWWGDPSEVYVDERVVIHFPK